MREGDIVVIDAAPDVLVHARLKRPLVSGWIVELVCEKGVEYMRESGHPAHTGYTLWTPTETIGYDCGRHGKEIVSCDERCIFEEEAELYKTYGGD